MGRLRLFLLLLFIQRIATSATLPRQLTPSDISKVVEYIGAATVTKLLRSAEPYPFFFPGIKIGIEINMFPADEVYRLGNALGSGAGVLPMPRLHIAKSLFPDWEVIASFLPNSINSPVNTWGGILKYSFVTEEDSSYSAAVFGGMTWIRGFNAAYEGMDYEAGIVLSKDFVRLRPYLGATALLATGTVLPAFALTSDNAATRLLIHSFLGAEILLPVSLSFQLDLFNLSPKASIFVGKTF